MKPIAEEFPKWQEWASRIEADVGMRLVHPRPVFRGFVDIVNANAEHFAAHEGDVFFSFVRRCYVANAATAIRSHAKKRDSGSFARLLAEIRDCATKFTFQFYLQQFPIDPTYVNWQTVTFSPFTEDGATVSPQFVQKDIDCLNQLAEKVETLVDRTLAHLDPRGFEASLTFGELDECVDAFDRLVCKYLKLIVGGGPTTLEPTILSDWTKVFTVPFDIRLKKGRRETK